MEVTILLGGTAQTGGVGKCAAVVPEPTRPILGTVPGPAPILVLVPGQVHVVIREAIRQEKCSFFEHCSNGGGVKPMFKNYVGNCRVFWRSFNNMKFA